MPLDFDRYEFPDPAEMPILAWMGPDYVMTIAESLVIGFEKQDPGVELVAMKAEGDPKIETGGSENEDGTMTVRSATASFPIQLLLKRPSGDHMALYGTANASGDRLGTEETEIKVGFELERSEDV